MYDNVSTKDVLKMVRKNPQWNKTHAVYDCFGNVKSNKKFPVWYSDSCKLVFPKKMYSEKEVNEIKSKIEEYISKNNYKLHVFMSESYSGGFHAEVYNLGII